MLIERMRKRLSPLTGRASSILPPIPSRQAPVRLQLDSRDQARRFPAVGPARSCRHPADHPRGRRLDAALSAGGGGREPPQGAVVSDRWRGSVLANGAWPPSSSFDIGGTSRKRSSCWS